MNRCTAVLAVTSVCLSVVAFASTPDLPTCDSWMQAASCNYTVSSRPSAYSINYMIIHKAEGTAAGSASWMRNCNSGVSAHYNIDNNTGYCYQSCYEKDVAWHAGNWSTNCHSIGIEHAGYTANNDTKAVCYDESAIETKACINYYSVTWDRSHILGHIQVPGATHTDPGVYWNWTYYMAKCNPNPSNAVTYICDNSNAGFSASANWATGTSSSDKYGTNYRYRPTAALSDTANWSINVSTAGNYDISAWWTVGTNRTANTAYTLPGGTAVYVNQQANGGKWNLLGTVNLASGANVTKLSCWAATGFVAVADAVKYYGPK